MLCFPPRLAFSSLFNMLWLRGSGSGGASDSGSTSGNACERLLLLLMQESLGCVACGSGEAIVVALVVVPASCGSDSGSASGSACELLLLLLMQTSLGCVACGHSSGRGSGGGGGSGSGSASVNAGVLEMCCMW